MRYFTQAISEDDEKRKDMLLDIATEELSSLEVIASIVAMLSKGVKAKLAEGTLAQGELMNRQKPGADLGAGPGADSTKPVKAR
jgi:Mn-containing catalase